MTKNEQYYSYLFCLYLTRTYLILAEPSVVVEKSIAPNEAPIKGLNQIKKKQISKFLIGLFLKLSRRRMGKR